MSATEKEKGSGPGLLVRERVRGERRARMAMAVGTARPTIWPSAREGGGERGKPTVAEGRRGEKEWACADGLRRPGRESEGPRAS